MFLLRSFFVSLFLLSVQFSYTMDKGTLKHLGEIHCHNSDATYRDIVWNNKTGVSSVRYTDTKRDYLNGQRKTVFPQGMDNKYVSQLIALTIKDTPLFEHAQNTGDTVQYKQINVGKSSLPCVVVKNKVGNLVTAYPGLRYISLQELSEHGDTDSLYIATYRDKKTGNKINLNTTVQDIKKLSRSGAFLALRDNPSGFGKEYLVDISQFFTNHIFYGTEEKRGSILVETDWINPR